MISRSPHRQTLSASPTPTPGGSGCGAGPGSRALVEFQRWLGGLPPEVRQHRAARLLNRLGDTPGLGLAWTAWDMESTLGGDLPASADEMARIRGECLVLLQHQPTPGQWTVQALVGEHPGIQLAPGGLMIDYLRELRRGPGGRRNS